MSSIVVDANLAVALVVPLPYSAAARAKFDTWAKDGTEILAPALWGYEITSSLRKAIRTGYLAGDKAEEALHAILALGVVEISATRELHAAALVWAAKLNATVAYDAAYLAIAESRQVELWTADARLVAAAKALEIKWVRAVGA